MTSTTSVSSTSTASSSDHLAPGPSKKMKMVKKEDDVKPSKMLAKNARKKNDKKCQRSILKHVEEARKVTSKKFGSQVEKELQRIEKLIETWKKGGLELDAIQRFVGRILKFVKDLDVIVACDHAVFRREMGLISLLEMDLVSTLNETGPITPEVARMKANKLLSLVLDSDCRNRIQQTWDGMAWKFRSELDMTATQG